MPPAEMGMRKMKLVHGVYFYQRGDMVYLRNVNDKRDYLFTSIVFDILSCIKAHPGCDLETVCQFLLRSYDVEDIQSFREDIHSFIQELTASNILEEDAATPIELHQSISGRVDELSCENGQLSAASLELTYRCSERCIHCYVDDCGASPEPELSFDEYKDILHQLKELGCIRLLLTGGEVCLRKDFIDIARYAVSLGFLVDVYSNGISMTDAQFDALCEMKVNSVSFSLYSGDAAVHDAITKVPGSFERTLKRAMMFKCAGVDTYIKTVVIQQNLDSLEGLYRLGRRIGIDVKAATSIADTHTGQSAQPYRLDCQQQRIKAIQLIDRYDPQRIGVGERDLDAHVCSAGVTAVSIDPYGGVHPCLAFSTAAGSVRNASLEEIWKHASLMCQVRAVSFRDLSPACADCRYVDHCGVCIGSAYEESNGRFCPNADTCQWSEAKCKARDFPL